MRICPAADWQGRLACPTREHAENPADMGPRCCSPAAAPRWLTGGSRAFPAPRWSTALDSNLVAAGSLADARTACGRQARTVRPMWACGACDRRPVPAVCRRTRPGHGRPNALFVLTLRAISADALGQLDVLAGAGPTCPGRLRTRCARADAQARRLPLPAGMLALTSAAICPVAGPPPPSCPMRPGRPSYHCANAT